MVTTNVVETKVTVQQLLDAGLHFGHQTKRWNPKMKPFIFGERNGIYIIDLLKSLECLTAAQQFVYDAVVRGRKVLFVGTKKQARGPIRELAEKANQPYVVNRWLGGMLTNSRTVRQSVKRMRELEQLLEEGSDEKMNKKEIARLRRELNKLHQNLSGVADMESMPAAMFVVDINRDAIAVKEANILHIPVIAMLDTNSDPDQVDYPIPGNDDAIRAIQLVAGVLSETIEKADQEYTKVAAIEARKKAERDAEEAAARKKAEEARKREEEKAAAARKAAIEKARAKREAEKAKSAKSETQAKKEPAPPQAEKKAESKSEAAAEPAPAEQAAAKPEEKPAEKAQASPAPVPPEDAVSDAEPAEETPAEAPADSPAAEETVRDEAQDESSKEPETEKKEGA